MLEKKATKLRLYTNKVIAYQGLQRCHKRSRLVDLSERDLRTDDMEQWNL